MLQPLFLQSIAMCQTKLANYPHTLKLLTYTHPNRKRESAIPTVAALMNETNATLLCKGCKIILQYYPHFVVHIFTNYMLLLLPRIGIVRAVI